MTGSLVEGVAPQLLRDIYVGRRTGWLHIVRGEEQQSLRFGRGHIVNARTNVVEERLGELMVRRGLLSEADLARATEIVIREKRRLGAVLTDLGLVDASGLEDAVALHVHEMLAKVFSWTDGTFSFEAEEDAPGGDLTLKLSTGELILEAVRAVRDPEAVRGALGDLDRVPTLSSDPLLRFQKLTLSPTDGFVLSRVDGTTSARELVQMIALPAEDVEKSLFGLLSTGVIEYTGSVRRGRGPGATTEPARPLEPTPAPHGPAPSPPASAAPPPAPTSASHAAAPAAPAPPLPIPTAAPPAAPASSGNAAADRVAAEQRREIQDAWEGLRTRNHFEVLGLKRNVSEAEVKEAYFGLAKRFHPDVHHGSSLSDLHDQLEAVFIRLGEAYDVLRDPRRRTEYEERLGRTHPSRPATPRAGTAPVTTAGAGHDATGHASAGHDAEEDAELAEDAIRRAQKLFEKAAQREKGEDGDARAEAGGSEYWDAIQLLEPVVNKAQGRLRSRGEILLARCYLKNPRWSRRAEETLIAVTRRDPGAPDAWALLGGIYAAKGMQNRALNMYRKTLELRPEHEEAARYLAANGAVEDPPARPEEGGLLRRLFRKS